MSRGSPSPRAGRPPVSPTAGENRHSFSEPRHSFGGDGRYSFGGPSPLSGADSGLHPISEVLRAQYDMQYAVLQVLRDWWDQQIPKLQAGGWLQVPQPCQDPGGLVCKIEGLATACLLLTGKLICEMG